VVSLHRRHTRPGLQQRDALMCPKAPGCHVGAMPAPQGAQSQSLCTGKHARQHTPHLTALHARTRAHTHTRTHTHTHTRTHTHTHTHTPARAACGCSCAGCLRPSARSPGPGCPARGRQRRAALRPAPP
jgi:hypothetical protein